MKLLTYGFPKIRQIPFFSNICRIVLDKLNTTGQKDQLIIRVGPFINFPRYAFSPKKELHLFLDHRQTYASLRLQIFRFG